MKPGARVARLLLVVVLAAVGCAHRGEHHRAPTDPDGILPIVAERPDFDAYRPVSVDDYRDTDEVSKLQTVAFRTPDGLTCALDRGSPRCKGDLPGTPRPANMVTLGGFSYQDTPPVRTDRPAKLLPVGHRITDGGGECAVGAEGRTLCRGGTPEQWFVVAPNGSGAGPRTEGLPEGFPDPKRYVRVDEGEYHHYIWVYFTTESGLTCEMWSFSGYEFGCDGPMPAAPNGANEIYLSGFTDPDDRVGMRHTDTPRFDTPKSGREIRRLSPGTMISYNYEARGACLATDDGGAACFLYGWGPGRPFQGFLVTPTVARTFG